MSIHTGWSGEGDTEGRDEEKGERVESARVSV
jgi:hypothetical protein